MLRAGNLFRRKQFKSNFRSGTGDVQPLQSSIRQQDGNVPLLPLSTICTIGNCWRENEHPVFENHYRYFASSATAATAAYKSPLSSKPKSKSKHLKGFRSRNKKASHSNNTEKEIKKRYEALIHEVKPKKESVHVFLRDLGQFHHQRPWAAKYATKLLENMWKNYNAKNAGVMMMGEEYIHLIPTTVHYNKVINLCARSPDVMYRKKAMDYYEELEAKFETTGNESLRPDVVTYTTLIDAFAKSSHKGTGEKAEAILNQMQEKYDAGDKSVRPNLLTMNCVVNCWAKEGNAIRAQAIVDRMEQQSYEKKGYGHLRPDTVSYNALINAWSRSGAKGAGEKSEAILNQMQEKYEAGDKSARPSIWSINSVLNCRVKEGNVARAEAIVNHLEHLRHQKKGYGYLRPNTVSYNTLINAWSMSGEEGAGDKAEAILNRMQEKYEAGDKSARPDMLSINSVIKCRAKEGNAKRAQAIVDHLEQLRYQKKGYGHLRPDTITYNALINAWSRSGEVGAGDKAEAILNQMQEKYNAGDKCVKPDTWSINSVVHCWAKEGNAIRAQAIVDGMEELRYQKGFEHLQPNSITYNTLINAWSMSGEKGAGDKAEAILNQMQEKYEAGVKSVQPNQISITSVVKCWAKEGNVARAQAIVDHVEQCTNFKGNEHLRPDYFTYNTLINAWSMSGEEGAGDKAEAILNKMQEKYEGGEESVKPNLISLNIVLNCWAKEGNGARAQAIVDHMEQIMHKKGFVHLQPDKITYTTLIDAWARSGEEGAGRKAEAIVDHMETLMDQNSYGYLQPDSITYNAVIDAWAYSGEKVAQEKVEGILNMMQEKYEDGNTQLKPGIRTFGGVVNYWAKEGNETKAEAIIERMERFMHQNSHDINIRSGIDLCRSLIETWSSKRDEKEADKEAMEILKKMQDIRS